MRRGQLSPVIIVLVVVSIGLIVSATLYSRRSTPPQNTKIPAEVLDVQSVGETCAEDLTREGLNLQGYQGGLIDPSNRDGYDISAKRILYWYKDGADVRPAERTSQEQLQKYVADRFQDCMKGSYKNLQFDGAPSVHIIFNATVRTIVANRVQWTYQDKPIQVDTFESTVRIPYRAIRKIADNITSMHTLYGSDVNLDNLLVQPVNITIYHPRSNILIYEFNSYELGSLKPYIFRFAIRTSVTSPESNNPPVLIGLEQFPDHVLANVPHTFTFTATDLDGDAIYFFIEPALGSLNATTGKWTFTLPAGVYYTMLSATDGKDTTNTGISFEVRNSNE
jgi:hypothetical protein